MKVALCFLAILAILAFANAGADDLLEDSSASLEIAIDRAMLDEEENALDEERDQDEEDTEEAEEEEEEDSSEGAEDEEVEEDAEELDEADGAEIGYELRFAESKTEAEAETEEEAEVETEEEAESDEQVEVDEANEIMNELSQSLGESAEQVQSTEAQEQISALDARFAAREQAIRAAVEAAEQEEAQNDALCKANVPLNRQAAWLSQMAYNTKFHSELTWTAGTTLTYNLNGQAKAWKNLKIYEKSDIGAYGSTWVREADKIIVFAIGGTRSAAGWMTDFNIVPVDCANLLGVPCGKVHRGFFNQASFFLKNTDLLAVLGTYAKNGFKVVVTGESLGAAIAPIVAAAVQNTLKKTLPTIQVMSLGFGMPPIGDATFVGAISSALPGGANLRFTNDVKAKTCLMQDGTASDPVGLIKLPGYSRTGVDCRLNCRYSSILPCSASAIAPYGLACHHPKEYVYSQDPNPPKPISI